MVTVLPRLTTAHNFRLRSLAMYRFLCALANHGIDNVGWNWGPLAASAFLPFNSRKRLEQAMYLRSTSIRMPPAPPGFCPGTASAGPFAPWLVPGSTYLTARRSQPLGPDRLCHQVPHPG